MFLLFINEDPYMMWSGKGWCLEGILEGLEPRQSCCNRVFSRKLWRLQLEEKHNKNGLITSCYDKQLLQSAASLTWGILYSQVK